MKSGDVYGVGNNRHQHFRDDKDLKDYKEEQLIPFFDTKDSIEGIKTFKRMTIAYSIQGKAYGIGDKLKKLLKIKDERFGFFTLPVSKE